MSDDWSQGTWSTERGFPSAVALHGGRLYHAQGGSLFGSVSNSFESFDAGLIGLGDSAPILKTLGAGPVDNIHYLVSLLRLIIGTSGAEIALRSSSLDEPVTPENSNARTFSTQGSMDFRAVKRDTSAVFVQRSKQRVFLIGFGTKGDALGDYSGLELTFLVPDLLEAGVISIAIQRQPDTRIHFVLADGTVAILTYEPDEEVLAWSTWSTDTGSDAKVEQAVVLPGVNEDAIYYSIRRRVNGETKRFLEKWAREVECEGDTGLSFIMDCSASYTQDTGDGRTTTAHGFDHLIGEGVVAWINDTGQNEVGNTFGRDLSADDTGQFPAQIIVDTGGNIDTPTEFHHLVGGLYFQADYRSTKLAYAAQAGTALTQMKRTDKMGLILFNTHNNALLFGNDTGHLDPMPRVTDEGVVVDKDKIFKTFDQIAIPFNGLWNEDSRVFVRARAPRPATVLALVPTVRTHEKI